MKKFASLYAATFLLVFLISVPHVCSADKIPTWFVGGWFFEMDYDSRRDECCRAQGAIVFSKPQWVDGKRCGGIGVYSYAADGNKYQHKSDKTEKVFQYTWDFSKDPIWLDIKSDYPLGTTIQVFVGGPFNDRKTFPLDQAGLDWLDKVSKDYYTVVDQDFPAKFDYKIKLHFFTRTEIYSVPVTTEKFKSVRCVVVPPKRSLREWLIHMNLAKMHNPTIKRWPKNPSTVLTTVILTGNQPRPEKPLDVYHPRTFRLRRSKSRRR